MATLEMPPPAPALLSRPRDRAVESEALASPPAEAVPADQRPMAGSQMAVYLPWVDLLRFVACVLVIYSHATVNGDRVAFGHSGVALFFSISGYLIGTVLKNMYGQPGWYPRFYVNRFLRIFPPLVAGLAFFGILVAMGFANKDKPDTLAVFLRNVVYMLTFTEPLSPDKGTWIPYGIVWTLCIEEWFYLMLPLIFLAVGPRRAAWVLIGLIVLTCEPALNVLPGTNYGTWFFWPVNLLGGAVLALMNFPKYSGFPWIGWLGLIGLVANAAVDAFEPFGPVMGLVTTLTVWSFATTTTAYPKLLNWALFAGKRSYGIYLLHIAAVSVGIRVARKALNDATSGPAFDLIACGVAVALSVLAAAIMWSVYEEPILNFRKRVKKYPVVYWMLLVAQLGLVPAGVAYWLLVG